MIEFALILPTFFILLMGLIYIGIMFMGYIHVNNIARDMAREISVTSTVTKKNELITAINNETDTRTKTDYQLTRLYSPKFSAALDTSKGTTTVTVTFTRMNDVPNLVKWWNFPPETLAKIEYTMKLENTGST